MDQKVGALDNKTISTEGEYSRDENVKMDVWNKTHNKDRIRN